MIGREADVDWRVFFTFPCPRCDCNVTPAIPPEKGDPWICHSCGSLGSWVPQKKEAK